MVTLAFLLGVAGMTCLAGGMPRHRPFLMPEAIQASGLTLRLMGFAALAVSWWLTIRTAGWPIGTLTWLGLSSIAAATVLLRVSRSVHRRR